MGVSPWSTLAQISSGWLAVRLGHKGGTVSGLLESGWVLPSVPGTIAVYMHSFLSLLAVTKTKIFQLLSPPSPALRKLPEACVRLCTQKGIMMLREL